MSSTPCPWYLKRGADLSLRLRIRGTQKRGADLSPRPHVRGTLNVVPIHLLDPKPVEPKTTPSYLPDPMPVVLIYLLDPMPAVPKMRYRFISSSTPRIRFSTRL